MGVVLGGALVVGQQGSAAGLAVGLLAKVVGERIVPGKRQTNKTNSVRPTAALMHPISIHAFKTKTKNNQKKYIYK